MSSYMTLVDLMRVLLRESNNADDFRVIMRAFTIANLYAVKCDGISIPIRSGLRYHEAWLNVDFWLFCTDELVSRDVQRWTRYSAHSFDLLAMDDVQVNGILAVNRVQAILASMHTVGITEDAREDYLLGVVEYFGLIAKGINILQPPTERFIAWLLDIALIHREEHKSKVAPETPLHMDKRAKSAELGYCPLQEMLFSVANKLQVIPPKKPVAGDDMLCICGMTLGGWQPMGLFEKRLSHRENLPSILCETCYRQIICSPLECDRICTHTNRCVVPMTEPEPPFSFSSVFYGHGTAEQRRADMSLDLSKLVFPMDNSFLNYRRQRQRGSLGQAYSETSQSSNGAPPNGHSRDNSGDQSWTTSFHIPQLSHDATPRLGSTPLQSQSFHNQSTSNTNNPTTQQSRSYNNINYSNNSNNSYINYNNNLNTSHNSSQSSFNSSFNSTFSAHSPGSSTNTSMSSNLADGITSNRRNVVSTRHHPTQAETVTAVRSSTAPNITRANESDRERDDLAKFVQQMRMGIDVIKMGWSALSRQRPRVLFLDQSGDRLCWQPIGRPHLVPDVAHSLALKNIRQIRVGSGRWVRCVSLVFEERTLVLKVEDQRLFKTLVDGLILLTDSYRNNKDDR
eukprot:CAMPEP_0182418460 /NCGR_PEP_ID=MMETSP1167-20130531/2886_1 /TAXON_ID=2988 /ORGANISM="Mallomonas Sp, Strain CCMP3275" /LENGTH=624 /DNA_ID=CAMNT_0024592675 /DNA_START=493 /DNA_END=2367 /DNA_ORIENTATION=-